MRTLFLALLVTTGAGAMCAADRTPHTLPADPREIWSFTADPVGQIPQSLRFLESLSWKQT